MKRGVCGSWRGNTKVAGRGQQSGGPWRLFMTMHADTGRIAKSTASGCGQTAGTPTTVLTTDGREYGAGGDELVVSEQIAGSARGHRMLLDIGCNACLLACLWDGDTNKVMLRLQGRCVNTVDVSSYHKHWTNMCRFHTPPTAYLAHHGRRVDAHQRGRIQLSNHPQSGVDAEKCLTEQNP